MSMPYPIFPRQEEFFLIKENKELKEQIALLIALAEKYAEDETWIDRSKEANKNNYPGAVMLHNMKYMQEFAKTVLAKIKGK